MHRKKEFFYGSDNPIPAVEVPALWRPFGQRFAADCLLDHLWDALLSGGLWMTCVGRPVFHIYAFQKAAYWYYPLHLIALTLLRRML